MIVTILLLGLIAAIGVKRLRDWQDFAAIERRAGSLIPPIQADTLQPQCRHPSHETSTDLPPRYISPEQHRNQLRHASISLARRSYPQPAA